MQPSKNDWKLFRDKITIWQEAYMEKLVCEYSLLLNSDLPASSKFWALEKRLKTDKNKPGVILSLRKQEMALDIFRLIKDGTIGLDDLEEFSEELKNYIKIMLENYK